MKFKLSVLASSLFLIGCTQPISLAPSPTFSSPNHVVDSSSKPGDELRIVVGNPVIKVKDYWVTTRTDDSMVPSSGFVFEGGPNTIHIQTGQKLKIVGTTAIDSRDYIVLAVPHNSMSLLVDKLTGSLSSKALNGPTGSALVMMWTYKTTPAGITFTPSKTDSIASSRTYINYEFIYSGKTGNSLNFLYREYTSTDLAKPAFFQNVSYETSEKIIEFKTLKFELLDVTSNAIRVKFITL